MTVVSRLQLDHPALGTAGGPSLHAAVQALFQKVGDNLADRLFFIQSLASAASVDLEHNFRVPFGELRWDLYSWNTGTSELTRVTAATTPALSAYTVVATPGLTTTKTRVTNGSGATRNLVLVLLNDPIELDELVDVTVTAPALNQVLTWNGTAWVNGTPAASRAVGGAGLVSTAVNYAIGPSQSGVVVLVTDNSPPKTVTAPVHDAGFVFTVKDGEGFGGSVLARNGGTGTINGVASDFTMSVPYGAYTFISDGVSAWWRII